MCILFMYVSNQSRKAGVSRSPYKLILASNREEKFSRPTKPACFWQSSGDSHILAGQDLEELGTWLGVSKHGKLAILLNIMSTAGTVESLEESVSRGSLVTGFLRSPPGLPGCTYLKNLCHLDILEKYKPFHLITVDFGCKTEANKNVEETVCDCKNSSKEACPACICMTYLTNQTQKSVTADKTEFFEPKHMSPPANTCKVYAFGNSLIDKPFRKVERGKAEFEDLVAKHCEKSESHEISEDSLVEELLQFLKSTDRYFPDKVMEEKAKEVKIPMQVLPSFSARFVRIPGVDYGTRTHTIVLVDLENNVTFHEWTMTQPTDPTNSEWSHSKFTFPLTPSSPQTSK